jgi:hypothetical protein
MTWFWAGFRRNFSHLADFAPLPPTVSLADYLLALVRLALLAVPPALAARAWRRRVASSWHGSLAALADAVGALSLLLVVSELLGTFGLFRPAVLLPVVVALAVASVVFLRPPAPIEPQEEVRDPQGEVDVEGQAPAAQPRVRRRNRVVDLVIAATSSALIVAQWSTWAALGVQTGIGRGGGPGNGDSLWYHMPTAAAFVQTGWTTKLLFLNGEALVTYYPMNTSVLHALAFLAMGNDSLSVLLNLAMIPLALLAGWCIGEGAGMGASSLAGVAVALTIPVVVVSEAGTAKDDVLGLVGLLAAMAFVVHPDAVRSPRAMRIGALFSGLACGLALGSKLTLVAPTAALLVVLAVLTPKPSRVATVIRFVVGTAVTGGYWYLRNLFAIGNPIPGLKLLPLPHPVTPSMDIFGQNLLSNIRDKTLWRLSLLPGLRTAMGPAWFVILGVMALAMAVGLVTLRRRLLVPVVVSILALGAFFVTPGTVWAPRLLNEPFIHFITANLFAFNVRYMLPAVAIALVIVPLVVMRWGFARLAVTTVLGVVLAATQLGRHGSSSWASGHAAVAIAAGAAVFVLVALGPVIARFPKASVAVLAIAVAVGGLPFVRAAQRDRYSHFELAQWTSAHLHTRIGYAGFVFAYPLWGPHLENHVAMVGQHLPDGGWRPAANCEIWRREAHADGRQFIVVPVGGPAPEMGIDLARWRVGLPGGSPPDEPAESRWTRYDPNARIVDVVNGLGIYRLTGPATTAGC